MRNLLLFIALATRATLFAQVPARADFVPDPANGVVRTEFGDGSVSHVLPPKAWPAAKDRKSNAEGEGRLRGRQWRTTGGSWCVKEDDRSGCMDTDASLLYADAVTGDEVIAVDVRTDRGPSDPGIAGDAARFLLMRDDRTGQCWRVAPRP